MAINMSDKKGLLRQILGEAEITVTTSGLTISGPRLSTPRFLPFDESGRCRSCNATEVEVDTMVTKEGVTIWCTRIDKVQFLPFDVVYDLPGHCFFRLKNKSRVFNLPYGDLPSESCEIPLTQHVDEERDLKRKAKAALELVEAGLIADSTVQDGARMKKAKTAMKVISDILLSEPVGENQKKISQAPAVEKQQQPPPQQQEQQQQDQQSAPVQEKLAATAPAAEQNTVEVKTEEEKKDDLGDIDKTLDEFFASLKAATTSM